MKYKQQNINKEEELYCCCCLFPQADKEVNNTEPVLLLCKFVFTVLFYCHGFLFQRQGAAARSGAARVHSRPQKERDTFPAPKSELQAMQGARAHQPPAPPLPLSPRAPLWPAI